MAIRSLEDIEQQIKALQAEAEEIRMADAIEQLRAIIRKYNVGLSHFKLALTSAKGRRRDTKKRSPVYRNPNDPSQTWSGRGRKPRWLVAAIDAGNTVEQCKIGPSSLPNALPARQFDAAGHLADSPVAVT